MSIGAMILPAEAVRALSFFSDSLGLFAPAVARDVILANRARRDHIVAKPSKSSKSSVRDNSGDAAAETITTIRCHA